MAQASIGDVRKFFKTGDPARDNTASFAKEWKALSDDEKAFFKDNVPVAQ